MHEPDKPWSSQKPSCTNSRKELRRCCSPIEHNNTKHFMCPIRSKHSLDRLEMVRRESVPRGSSAQAWKLSSRLLTRPDWLAPGSPRMFGSGRAVNNFSALITGLKTGVENDSFWSEIGSGFGEPGSIPLPPPRIPRSTPNAPPPPHPLVGFKLRTTTVPNSIYI